MYSEQKFHEERLIIDTQSVGTLSFVECVWCVVVCRTLSVLFNYPPETFESLYRRVSDIFREQ